MRIGFQVVSTAILQNRKRKTGKEIGLAKSSLRNRGLGQVWGAGETELRWREDAEVGFIMGMLELSSEWKRHEKRCNKSTKPAKLKAKEGRAGG